MTTQSLPSERWLRVQSFPPMEAVTDAWAQLLDRRVAAKNDYANLDASILPLLAWEKQAIAYDPGGSEFNHREALRRNKELYLA